MRNKLSSTIAATVLSVAMMVSVATASGASAADKRAAVVVPIGGRLDATNDEVPNSRCAGKLYSGTPEARTGAVYKGTLDGVSGFCGQVRLPLVEPDGSGVDYHEDHTFVGTVHGCGTGSFKYSLDGVLHPYDAVKRYIPSDEYWNIVEGTGTGDLAGIRSGVNHRAAGVNPDGSLFAVFDPAMNSLTCTPPQLRPQSESGRERMKPRKSKSHAHRRRVRKHDAEARR